MPLTIQVIVEGTIASVRDRILGIETIYFMELFHQWHKAVHVRAMLHYIYHRNVFIRYTDLDIVSRQQLVISHIILFHPHECGIMVCF